MATTSGPILRKQNVDIPDTLTAKTKYFIIDHPTIPGKHLAHAAVESNRHLVMYEEVLTFHPFERHKELPLPEYFWTLIRTYPELMINVQLTPIDNFGRFTYAIDISKKQITIRRRGWLTTQAVSCLIIGERADIDRLQEIR